MTNEIELLGNPDQGAYVTDRPRAKRTSGSEVGNWGRVRRAQYDLSRDGPTCHGIPDGLRGDPVPTAGDDTFENVHFFM
jgi:hypothetical protein